MRKRHWKSNAAVVCLATGLFGTPFIVEALRLAFPAGFIAGILTWYVFAAAFWFDCKAIEKASAAETINMEIEVAPLQRVEQESQ